MTMETSYSVHFIGHLPLTFQSSRGKILSESVMSPMARRFLSRCPRLRLSETWFRIAPACWVVPACGGYSFALSHAKIAGHSGGMVNSQKRPPGPAFSGIWQCGYCQLAPSTT